MRLTRRPGGRPAVEDAPPLPTGGRARLWLGNALIFAMIGFGVWWFAARAYALSSSH